MNEVEDRVREALRAHAEDFTAAPDAWQRLRAKTTRRRSWPVRFIVPASAATFAAGWPGRDIRLWSVRLPRSIGHPIPPMTLTGYDAAGHVVERVALGTSVLLAR